MSKEKEEADPPQKRQRKKREWGAIPPPPPVSVSTDAAASTQDDLSEKLAKASLIKFQINSTLNKTSSTITPGKLSLEIPINDSAQRIVLTKKTTPEYIFKTCGVVVVSKGRYIKTNSMIPASALPLGEKPLYLHLFADTQAQLDKAKQLIEGVMAGKNLIPVSHSLAAESTPLPSGPMSGPPPPPPSSTTISNHVSPLSPYLGLIQVGANMLRLNIGIDVTQTYGFPLMVKLMGGNNEYLGHIEKASNAVVFLKGVGSSTGGIEPLHFLITGQTPASLQIAGGLSENLVQTVRAEFEAYLKERFPAVLNPPAPSSSSYPSIDPYAYWNEFAAPPGMPSVVASSTAPLPAALPSTLPNQSMPLSFSQSSSPRSSPSSSSSSFLVLDSPPPGMGGPPGLSPPGMGEGPPPGMSSFALPVPPGMFPGPPPGMAPSLPTNSAPAATSSSTTTVSTAVATTAAATTAAVAVAAVPSVTVHTNHEVSNGLPKSIPAISKSSAEPPVKKLALSPVASVSPPTAPPSPVASPSPATSPSPVVSPSPIASPSPAAPSSPASLAASPSLAVPLSITSLTSSPSTAVTKPAIFPDRSQEDEEEEDIEYASSPPRRRFTEKKSEFDVVERITGPAFPSVHQKSASQLRPPIPLFSTPSPSFSSKCFSNLKKPVLFLDGKRITSLQQALLPARVAAPDIPKKEIKNDGGNLFKLVDYDDDNDDDDEEDSPASPPLRPTSKPSVVNDTNAKIREYQHKQLTRQREASDSAIEEDKREQKSRKPFWANGSQVGFTPQRKPVIAPKVVASAKQTKPLNRTR